MTFTVKHTLLPVEKRTVPNCAFELYRQGCTCGFTTRWYVYKGNAARWAQWHVEHNAPSSYGT